MTAKVETYFIEPLESHFEDQPTAGGRETILEDMEAHDEEVLNQAVEWLKRNRQSQKTFPAPKECNKAVAAVLAEIKQVEVARKFDAPQGASYGEKLKKWVEAGGRAHVITKGTFERREWEIYFLATGNKVQYPLMRSKDSWTVPTQVPKAFDHHYDWNAGSKLLEQREASDAILDVPERRAWVIQEMKRLRF